MIRPLAFILLVLVFLLLIMGGHEKPQTEIESNASGSWDFNNASWRNPPRRFQGDGAAIVVFAHQAAITRLCGGISTDRRQPVACAFAATPTTPPMIILPNPCVVADVDLYAAVVCHEAAHVAGWPATHGDVP